MHRIAFACFSAFAAALAGPAASQAPTKLTFVDARNRHVGVYVINSDGTGLTRLTKRSGDRSPRWTPDGRRITFTGLPAAHEDADTELGADTSIIHYWPYYVMDADGQNLESLVADPAYSLRWSPDGQRFAFMAGLEDPANARSEIGQQSSAIYIAEPGGGTPRRICPVEGHDGPFAWSADGLRLLYVANRTSGFDDEGDWDVFVMNADGSDKTNLSSHPGRDTDPVWSADEKRIVFRSDRDGDARLYSVNARGEDLRQLQKTSPYDTPLFCTPDGKVVFSAATDVWVMGLDGSDPRKVASVDTGFATLREGDVALSPDGKTLAYVTRAGLFTVPIAGGEPKQLIEGGGPFQVDYAPAAR